MHECALRCAKATGNFFHLESQPINLPRGRKAHTIFITYLNLNLGPMLPILFPVLTHIE